MNELYHHGIRGQRWGIRRYQNKDGTLTEEGKRRANEMAGEYARLTGSSIRRLTRSSKSSKSSTPEQHKEPEPTKTKSLSEMSDKELSDALNRMRNEEAYKDLEKKRKEANTSAGKKFVKETMSKAGSAVAVATATAIMSLAINAVVKKASKGKVEKLVSNGPNVNDEEKKDKK